MTLIVTVNGRESIWLMADRRLSCRGRAPKDDARKVMLLDTKDGVAILGYAGLGATASGTETSDWMSAVLRGRNLTLEQSLGSIAEAMKKQLPRHLLSIPGPTGPSHSVIVPAILDDQVRLYSIDLVFTPDRKLSYFRFARHVQDAGGERTPRIGIAGSGAPYLLSNKDWTRPLLRIVSRYERGRMTSHAVADHLAELNSEVHKANAARTVGPSCVVAWRNKNGGRHKDGGGCQFYANAVRVKSTHSVPTISAGIDINAVIPAIQPKILEAFGRMRSGEPANLDSDELNALVAHLPDNPDEQLR